MTNLLDDPKANPFEVAEIAAAKIAELTGVAKHDIALTLGSGWAKAADLIGETGQNRTKSVVCAQASCS